MIPEGLQSKIGAPQIDMCPTKAFFKGLAVVANLGSVIVRLELNFKVHWLFCVLTITCSITISRLISVQCGDWQYRLGTVNSEHG